MTKPTKCTLGPGEICLYCGSVGQGKPKPKGPPLCELCAKDFSRSNGPWRIFRGRRRHIACHKLQTEAVGLDPAASVSLIVETADLPPPAPFVRPPKRRKMKRKKGAK